MDERSLEFRDSHASSSRESFLEFARSTDLGQHSGYNHFSQDRDCEICQTTKITRDPCRRRIGRAVLQKIWVIQINNNNDRYAVVAQDLFSQ